MRTRDGSRSHAAALVIVLLAAGCSGGPAGTDRPLPDAATDASLPTPICTDGARWQPGQRAFQDASADWGLDALGADGTRLAAVDFDGDGWTDLVVRRAGVHADDVDAGERSVWLLRNTGTGGFEDVTLGSGIVQTRRSYGSRIARPGEVYAFGDVDNDGDLDVYVGLDTTNGATALQETSELLLNEGGDFVLVDENDPIRRAGQRDVPAGAAFTDVDRDGKLDLWLAQHSDGTAVYDRLLAGTNTGAFEDVTSLRGLETRSWTVADLNQGLAHARSWSATACDLNGDGTPELMTASYGRAPDHLWQGQRASGGQTTFVNRSVASGYAYDANQSWQDNQFARCFCAANPAAAECAGLPAPAISCAQINWNHAMDREPFRLGGNSASTICADVNNDGSLDLLTTAIKHWWAGAGSDMSELLVNMNADDVVFSRPGRASMGIDVPHPGSSWDEGIMTAAVFDFDNDGWPDVYLGGSDYPGNRGLLFHQGSPLSFTPVPLSDGIDHTRSHGIAVADFDRDGDLDVVVGHSRARCAATDPDCYPTTQVRLFRNVAPEGNWIQLRLEGAQGTNRAAIGARVTVTTPDGVSQTQEVGGGYGHYGAQNDLVLHFGLGAGCAARVDIRWPDRDLSTTSAALPAGYRYEVVQGQTPVAVVP